MISTKTRVSIIVLNWNGRKWLKRCLSSISDQVINEEFEALLVDNGSTDDSIEYSKAFTKVKTIKLERNYGFAKGNNLGLEHANGEYLVFVNVDTEARSGWLENLVKAADEHPEYQILCSMQVPSQKENRIRTLDVFGNVTLSPFESASPITDSLFASGACFLIRREWLQRLGYLFDPYYFARAEDVELSLRTILLGGRIGYVRNSRIFHFVGGSDFPAYWLLSLATRNLLLTYYKLLTPNGFRRLILLRSIYIAYVFCRFVIPPWQWRKHSKKVIGMAKGAIDFFLNFERYKEYREEFMKKRLRDDNYLFQRMVCKRKLERILRKLVFPLVIQAKEKAS